MRAAWLWFPLLLLVGLRCQSAPSSSSEPPDSPAPQEPPGAPPGAPGPAPAPPEVPPPDPGGRVISVASQGHLVAAIRAAMPGDTIRLADATYVGGLVIDRSGLPDKPIILQGSRQAIVDGGTPNRSAILLKADHWVIQGISVTNGLRGVYVDGGNRNVLDDIEVSQIAQEAVHFANFSSDNIIENSSIHDTGLTVAEFGEGVYLGSSYTNWNRISGGLADQSDRNQVLNNVIGPNVRSEHVDVKEGTTGGIVRGNRLIGAGMVQSQFWVNSWMEVKGNDYQIIENHGTDAIENGFEVLSVLSGWGNNNVFHGNVAEVQGPGFGIHIHSGVGNLVGCDNVVTGAAAGFASVDCVGVPEKP